MALRRAIAICGAALLAGISSGLHAQLKNPRSTSDLASLCTSTDAERLAYCEGYLVGAAHLWKVMAACSSPASGEKRFCAGAQAAYEKFQEALQNCNGCRSDSVPDFRKRRLAFLDEITAALGICAPGWEWERTKEYCTGYNEEAAKSIAWYAAAYLRDERKGARDRGLGEGAGEVTVYLFAPELLEAFVPCLTSSVRPDELRKAFVEFVHEYPEQLRIDFPILALQKALFYELCPGPEKGLRPHMEVCTVWDYDGGQYGTRNACDEPVVIRFRSGVREAVEREVGPGGEFRTGLGRSDIRDDGAVFTVCPVGYESSPPFDSRNPEAIRKSFYSCVPK